MSISDIVNMAQAGWKIIEDGKPSAQITGSTCNAVPHVDDWQSLSSPQGTNRLLWRLKYTNGFSIDVVLVRFELKWEYAARYHNGGAFISNCWLHVPQCDVKFGYNVNLDFKVRNPTNSGSDAAPDARLPITVSGAVTTPFWTDNTEWDFTVYGDGNWEQG